MIYLDFGGIDLTYNPQHPFQNGQPYYGQPVPPAQQPSVQQYPVQQPVQQQPVQQPVRQYPAQQQPVPQYPVQQYAPQYLPPQLTPEEIRAQNYRRSLRRTVNGLGGLMLIFFGLQLILGVITTVITSLAGNSITDQSSPLFFLENGALSMIIFFVSALIYCFIKKVNFGEVFPFHKIGAGYLVKLCVIGLAFSLASNYVVDLLNNTFSLFGIENAGGNVDAGNAPNVFLYFLTVAVMPAFVEEFAFRGVVMGVLRPYSEGLAILVSSATFALMHGNFVQLPFTFCCGLVFAYIDIKADSLLPSIIVHFFNNGLSVLADILVTYNIASEEVVNMSYGIVFAVLAVLAFIFLKGIINKKENHYFDLKNGNDVIPFKTKVKTTASSPTLITFAAIMTLYCVLVLFIGV